MLLPPYGIPLLLSSSFHPLKELKCQVFWEAFLILLLWFCSSGPIALSVIFVKALSLLIFVLLSSVVDTQLCMPPQPLAQNSKN